MDVVQRDDVRVTNLLEDIDLGLNGDLLVLRLLLVDDFHREFLSRFFVEDLADFWEGASGREKRLWSISHSILIRILIHF